MRRSKLRVVGRAGVGVDNVDVETATRRGVIVMNAPGGNTVSTAEHAFSLLLSVARKIPAGRRDGAKRQMGPEKSRRRRALQQIVRHHRHGPDRQRAEPARHRLRHARPRVRSVSVRDPRAHVCRSSCSTKSMMCLPRPISLHCTRRSHPRHIICSTPNAWRKQNAACA